MKNHDVFHFRYNDKYIAEHPYWYHCFEGILIARKDGDKFYLRDNYWNGSQDIAASLSEWRKKGKLEFYVNLDDVEKISESERVYYSDNDLFRISNQHACVPSCVIHFRKKGAERNNEKMLKVVNEKIREEKKKSDYAIDELQRLAIKREKIEGGDLSVYL